MRLYTPLSLGDSILDGIGRTRAPIGGVLSNPPNTPLYMDTAQTTVPFSLYPLVICIIHITRNE